MNTAKNYHDPKTFWTHVKRLKENKSPANQYLVLNGINLIEDEETEEAHRKIWEEVFNIRQEEIAQYDETTEREVEEYLLSNEEKRTIYDLSDLRRLQGRYDVDSLITTEIITTIVIQKQHPRGIKNK